MQDATKRLNKVFSFFLIFMLLASVFVGILANSKLVIKDETSESKGVIYCIKVDDTYIYTGTQSGYVNKFWKSNMTYINKTGSYGGAVRVIAFDDTYIYAGGDTTFKVYQYWKSNLTKKAETPADTNTSIFAVAVDDNYLYVGINIYPEPSHVLDCKVFQYWKSNMTKRAESYDCGNSISTISLDDNYVYFCGAYCGIAQCWKSNMSTRGISAVYGYVIYHGIFGLVAEIISNDSTYFYVGGYGTHDKRTVNKYWKSNLSLSKESEPFGSEGGGIYALVEDDDYIYAGGSEYYANKYWKSNLTKKDETVSNGWGVDDIDIDADYIYIPTESYVLKYYKDVPPINYYVSNTQFPDWYDFNHTMTIQEAVDNISDGFGYYDYMIHVGAGTYNENVVVGKPCNIVGNGIDDTFITCNNTDYLFEITSNDVSISYLNISNVKSTGGTGIYLNMVDDCLITHNYIHDCNVSGIYYFGSDNNIISDNTICDDNGHVNAYGLYGAGGNGNTITNNIIFSIAGQEFRAGFGNSNTISYNTIEGDLVFEDGNYETITNNIVHMLDFTISEYSIIANNTINNSGTNGIYMDACSYCTIRDNTITNSTSDGFKYYTAGGGGPFSHNIIENNYIAYNVGDGISINDDNDTIRNNTVMNNGGYGINISGTSNDNNLIYNNSFINNAAGNAYDAYEAYDDTWNVSKTLGHNIVGGYYLGGNYYDDYTGDDTDGDGLGDTPYLLLSEPGELIYDYLPLVPPSMLQVCVYNESNCLQSLTFDILISNRLGTQTFEQKNCVGCISIPIGMCPTGTDVTILISSTGYKPRVYYTDLDINTTISLDAYLPPETPPGRDASQITLRAYTDSKTITNPATNVTIPLSYTLEDMISVEIYNDSLYGTYGGWIYVTADNYTVTSTQITIDHDILDSNSTMARATYYYEYYYEGGLASALYNLQVVETALESYYTQVDNPIENAKVIVKRYEPCTGVFTNMSILKTDANGYCNLYLMPYMFYKVFIYKSGYYDKVSDYIPQPPNAYGQTDLKIFRIDKIEVNITIPEKEYLFRNITWFVLPVGHLYRTSFTITFNISSSDGQLQWYYLRVWQYNYSNSTWTSIYYSNQSNANGGQISYTVPNITGRYMAECVFKKVGYSEYRLGQEGSFGWVIEHLQAWMQTIPDWAYMFVLTLISAVVMGFFMMYLGTGLMTGYIGIGIYVLGFLLHPVTIVVDHPGALVSSVSGWAIVTILIIVYTMGVYLWSRL